MLLEWTLENFKPIQKRITLELKPLTVLAGLNSTGKSSLLQSILLVSQTLESPNSERPLILNGNIIKLGTFDSIKNDSTKEDRLTIGFRASFEAPPPEQRRRSVFQPRVPDGESVIETKVTSTFRAGSQQKGDQTGIEAVKVALLETLMEVSLQSTSEEVFDGPELIFAEPAFTASLRAEMRPLAQHELEAFVGGVGSDYRRLIPYTSGENFLLTVESPLPAFSPPSTYLARLAHFIPDRLFQKFSTKERFHREIDRIIEQIAQGQTSWSHPVSPLRRELAARITSHVLSRETLQELRVAAQERRVPPLEGTSVVEAINWSQSSSLRTTAKSKFVRAVRDVILAELSNALADVGPAFEYGLMPGNTLHSYVVDIAAQKTISFFNTLVRYLGPLRADPQAAQGFAPSSEPDDVGMKGEYAAAVFEANKREHVTWFNPVAQSTGTSTLQEAVDVWCQHLGVAHHVSTQDAGLSGVSWSVQPLRNSSERPLQAVGVGVSQVLPILVTGLLAPRGAVILIEQPELHLHARAQARLGQFFLGLIKTGKQCIVETHSDCLVSELRFALVSADPASTNVKIYFAQQDEAGSTHFEEVRLTEAGSIANWPDGFFDESFRQEDRITRASLRRRVTKPS